MAFFFNTLKEHKLFRSLHWLFFLSFVLQNLKRKSRIKTCRHCHVTEPSPNVGKAVEGMGAHSGRKLNKSFGLVLKQNKIYNSSTFVLALVYFQLLVHVLGSNESHAQEILFKLREKCRPWQLSCWQKKKKSLILSWNKRDQKVNFILCKRFSATYCIVSVLYYAIYFLYYSTK